jgi:iron(III) transport system permease protein
MLQPNGVGLPVVITHAPAFLIAVMLKHNLRSVVYGCLVETLRPRYSVIRTPSPNLASVDHRTLILALNTLALAGAVCAVSVPLGTLLAWLLVRTDLLGRRLWLALLGLMLFVPLFLQAAAWQAGFGLQGWYTLAGFGLAPLDGWSGAIWIHAMAALPWVVLIVGFGLANVERELEESALLDASPRQVFWHVTLRAALPAVGVATLWTALTVAGEMTVTDLFGIRTYAEEVYTQMAGLGQEPDDAVLQLLPGMVLTAGLVMAGMLICRGMAPGKRSLSLQQAGWVFRLGAWRLPASIAMAALFALLIGLPLGNLAYKAGVLVTQTDAGLVREFSAAKCLGMIATAPGRHSREFGWSLLICPLSAAAAVLVAIPLAWFARRGGWRSLPALVSAAAALAVPGPVLGLAIIKLLNQPELPWLAQLDDYSILAPFLALFVRGLPAAIFVLWHALHSVPGELLDLAAVDGAGPVARLYRVALPMRWPAVLLAFLVSLAMTLGDLAASILVVPPGVTTLSIHIFGLLHYGVEDQVAGICLALIAMFAFVAAAAWGIIKMSSHVSESHTA